MKKHPCPSCGEETEGSYSEGGILWAICDRCMNMQRTETEEEEERRSEEEYLRRLSSKQGL